MKISTKTMKGSLLAALTVISLGLTSTVSGQCVSTASFGPGAVTESFEGYATDANNPASGFGAGYTLPGAVSAYTFATSGITLTNPIPNSVVLIGDFTKGSASWGLVNSSISSAADVPSGSAYLGLYNGGGSVTATFTLPVLASKVGMLVEDGPGINITLTAYNSSNVVIGTCSVAGTGQVSNWASNFLGFNSALGDIAKIDITGGAEAVVDQFTFQPACLTPPTGVTATANAPTVCPGIAFNLFSTSDPIPTNTTENFDGVTAPSLPSGWVSTIATGTDGIQWVTSSSTSVSSPNSVFVNDPASIHDKRLESPSFNIVSTTAQVSFQSSYDLESTYDGGVLEISYDGGATYTDIITAGGSFVSNGYNATISSSFGSPIAGRQAWSGLSSGFVLTTVNLPAAAAGQTIKLRWRMGSDNSVSHAGWNIDDITITDYLTPTFSWSSSPAGFTSSNQNPTGVTQTASTSYTVTVTGQSGCATTASVSVTTTTPVVNLGGPYVQCGGSVTLDAGNAGSTFLWSDNSSNQTLSASASGTYAVTVTDGNTCTGSGSANVTINTPPTINLGGLRAQCGGTVTLDAGVGSALGGADQSQTSAATGPMAAFYQGDLAQSFKPSQSTICGASAYISAGFGSGTGDITIQLYTNLPNAGGVLLATGTATGIAPGGIATVSWPTVNVTPGTTYYLVFTSTNSSLAIDGDVNNPYPGGDVYANTGFQLFSGFDYTFQTFTCNAFVAYSWSNGDNTQTTTVSTSNTYSVTVTDANTCTASASASVTINTPPTVSLGGPYTACGSQTLDAGNAGSTYLWSDNSTNQTLTATASGTYSVTVTDGNTCTGSGSTSVTINTPPTVNLGGPYVQCEGTVTLDAGLFGGGSNFTEGMDGGSSLVTYTPAGWFQQNNSTTIGTTAWFGGTTTFAPHSGAGYIAANFNNTTGTNDISNWLLTPNITLQNGDVFTFWTRTVNSPAFPDRLQVLMSTNGASTNVGTLSTDVGDFTTLLLDINPTLTTVGYPNTWTQYTVTISGLGGAASGRLAFRYFVTGGGPSGANSDYIGIDDVNYTSLGGTTYAWSNGDNTETTTVSTSNTYTVTVTDGNGCTGTGSASVTINSNPVVNLGGPYTACGSYTLDAGNAGDSYLWSDNSASQTLTATSTGTYTVTVTDANTCSGSGSAGVTINPVPNVATSVTGYTLCQGTTVPSGQGLTAVATGAVPTVSTATVTFTNTPGDETTVSPGKVIGTFTLPVLPAGATVTSASISIPGIVLNGASWGTEIRLVLSGAITQAGTSVATTNGTPNPVDGILIIPAGSVPTNGGVVTINYYETFNDITGGQDATFPATGTLTINYTAPPAINWYDAATAGNLVGTGSPFDPLNGGVANTAGTTTYYVETASSACTSATRVAADFTVNPTPVVNLGGPYVQCGGSVTLDAGNAGSTYLWSDNSTGQTLTTSTNGTYAVNVTDGNTCTASGSADVTINAVPSGVTASSSASPVCSGTAFNLSSTVTTAPPVLSENFDGVAAPALPAGWVSTIATGTDGINWVTSTSSAFSSPNSAFINDPASVHDKYLESPSILINTATAQLTFRNSYNLESTFDGGVLEISYDGGATYTDIITAGGSFVTGGYNATISVNFSSPIAGRQAWSGNSSGFIVTTVNLPAAAAGQTVKLRWRMGSDSSFGVTGWSIDDVSLTETAAPTFAWSSNPAGFTSSNQNPTGVTESVSTVYTVTVTGANGCTATASVTVNVNPLPVVNLGGPYTACGSYTLDAGNAGDSYLWSDNSASQTLTATSTGTYTVTVTDANTCSGSGSAGVTINPVPNVATSVTGYTLCQGTTVPSGQGLTAVATGAVPAVSTATVTFTNTPGDETTVSPGKVIGTFTLPVLPAGATVTSASISIPGIVLNSGSWGTEIRLVLSGAITQAGTQIASTNGTPNPVNGTLIIPAGSVPTSGGVVTINYYETFNDITGGQDATFPATGTLTINYTAPPAINWYDAATAGNLVGTGSPFDPLNGGVANTAGTTTYYVETASSTCTSATRVAADFTVNPTPVVTLGGPYVQCGGSVTLDAGNAGSTYLWSDNSTGQTLTTSTNGTYAVTVTDGNTCSGSVSASVTINTPPTVSLGGPYGPQCGGTVTLDAGVAVAGAADQSQTNSNTYMAGFGQGDLAQSFSPSVSTICGASVYLEPGIGSGTGDITIQLYTNLPNAGGTLLASGTATGVPVGGIATVSWSSVNVTPGTTYYLVYTSTNNSLGLAGNTNDPYPGGMTFANTGFGAFPSFDYSFETFSCGVAFTSYSWSNGDNTQTTTVSTSNTYSVTVTDANTCTASASASVTINIPPTVSLGGPYTACGSQTLDAGNAGSTYLWSDNSTNQTLTATASGTYSVTVMDGNTCTGSGSVDVTINAPPAGVTASSSASPVCSGTPFNLSSTVSSIPVAFTENFDGVTTPALPAGWVSTIATGTDGINWVTSTSSAFSTPNSAFINDPSSVHDKYLESPSILINTATAQLTFRNSYNLESTFDGGVLEISYDGGATYTDIITAGGSFVAGGYNATISVNFSSPILGRQAWSGNSGGFIVTTVNLPAAAAGQNIKLRWRMGSDSSIGVTGWWIDDVLITEVAAPTFAWSSNPAGFTSSDRNPLGVTANTTTVYTVTVTGANGCTATASVTVNVNPLPVVNLGGPYTACGSYTLDAGNAGDSYLWSDNSAAQTLTATSTGTYMVTVTDANTCSGSGSAGVTINPVPANAASVTGYSLCQGTTVPSGQGLSATTTGVVPATSTATVTFTNTAVDETTVSPGIVIGTFTLPVLPAGATVTSASISIPGIVLNGASWASEINLVLSGAITQAGTQVATTHGTPNPVDGTLIIPAGSVPTNGGVVTINYFETFNDITSGQDATFPATGTLTINYTAPPALNWYDAPTAGNLVGTGSPFDPLNGGVANTAGTTTYYVETASSACISATRVAADFTVNPTPVVNLGGPYVACVSQTLDAGNAGSAYAWSDGSTTTQTLDASTSDIYSVTVTDANTCSGTGSADVTINAAPVVSLGGPYVQCGGSVTLDAGNAGSTYAWSDGSTTTQTLDASASVTYSVTVTDANTCSGTGSADVTINAAPVVSLGGPYVQCGGSVTLDAGNAGSTYAWSDGSTTTQTLDASASSTYSVTVTDANTCSGTGSADVTINAAPVVSLGGPYVQCGGSVTLDAGNAGSTYAWSDGSTTTQTLDASASITYSVTVTDANTCSGTGSADVTINAVPVVSLGGPYVQCGGSVTLDAGNAGSTYAWSDGSTTTQTLDASASSTYSVTVTEANTCSGTGSADVTINAAPIVSLGGPYVQCGGSVTLDAGNAGSTYAWSDGSTTTQTLDASTSSTYSVTVTDANTCSGTGSADVTINAAPVVSLGGPYVQCGGSVTLDAGNAGSTYAWSDGSTTTQTLDASASVTYSVTVTDANTCSGTGSADVTINAVPVVSLGGPYVQCGGSVTLDAGNAGSTYAWSDNSTNQTLTASATGNYSVTVTGANTCTGSDNVSVTINTSPTVNLGNDVTQCGGSVTLDAGNAGSTYAWSDNSTNQTLTASATGNYSVTVTGANTCTGSDNVSVTINTLPTASLTLPVDSVCSGSSAVTLSGGSPAGGTFSGTNVSAGSFTPSSVGTYTVAYAYADNHGCADTAYANITVYVCVGINELSSGSVELYPNPASDFVTLKSVGITGKLHVEIYDIRGRKVDELTDMSITSGYTRTINLATYAAGTYIVNIVTDNGSVKYNLIVQ